MAGSEHEGRAERDRIGFSHLPDRHERRPWLLALAPPIIYLHVLAVRYALTPAACESTVGRIFLEGAAAAGLAAILVAGVVAWRASGRADVSRSSDVGGMEGARRLLLQVAVLGAGFFTLVTLATWVPSWILSPCVG